jgi:hypothetical protein
VLKITCLIDYFDLATVYLLHSHKPIDRVIKVTGKVDVILFNPPGVIIYMIGKVVLSVRRERCTILPGTEGMKQIIKATKQRALDSAH